MLIALGIFVFIQARTYSTMGVQIEFFGPAFFPQILCALIVFCGTLLVANAALGRSLRRTETIDKLGFGRLVLALLIGVLYWATIEITGFLIGTPIFLFVLMTVLGSRSWPKRAIGSLAAPLAVWAIFEHFLVISLPEGAIIYHLFAAK